MSVNKDNSGSIAVTFPYNPAYVSKVKTVPGHKWHPDVKYWTFPFSKEALNQILTAFGGEEVEIDDSLQELAPPSRIDLLLTRAQSLIRLKHYSIRTEKSYLPWIQRYLLFHHNRDPKDMGASQIEAFLSHLAVNLKVSASTQNQAFNALLFLYRDVLKIELDQSINAIRAKKPQYRPTVMTKEEVMRVIAAVPPEHQLMVKLIYGSGLRLMECLRLRVKDIDFGNNHIVVRDAKGMNDRVTVFPENLREPLTEHMKRVRAVHEDDKLKGRASVYLPYALERKYPNAGTEWGWQYVFPAKNLSTDPKTGITRRHHVHEQTLQSAVREAARMAGLDKPVSVHTLHSFATHLLEASYDRERAPYQGAHRDLCSFLSGKPRSLGIHIRTVQELLGHKDVSTTMIYTHVLNRPGVSVRSPLDG